MSRSIVDTPISHPDMPDPSILGRIANRLKERLRAQRVLVFGSVARGEASIHSDVDLLVIAPSSETPYWRMAHAREAVRDLSTGLPLSPMVLTPAEVEARVGKKDAFMRGILEEGIEL